MNKFEEINDNEIRLIGGIESTPRHKRRWLIVGIVLIVVAIVGIILAVVITNDKVGSKGEEVVSVFEPQPQIKPDVHPLRAWFHEYDSTELSGCALKDTVVNDIAIRIYLPLNARPALEIGMRPLHDNRVILAFQAADIRADNKKIVGAFVERGKPIAWGLSKKGYCAILHDSIYVGMADNSPLFEEATDCGGYFFRQYPLVADHEPQESELKSQSIRRALCDVDDHICVVETQEKASMHDFAVLLADLDVRNAIYLIGSDAMGIVTDLDGTRTPLGDLVEKPYKYTNFIYWTAR